MRDVEGGAALGRRNVCVAFLAKAPRPSSSTPGAIMNKLSINAIALALGFACSAGAMAEGMSKEDFKAAKTAIEATYKSEKAACDALSGNRNDICEAEVCYAVLSFGGFLGMGEKLFAVPWSALTLDRENRRFILNGDAKRFENAPGFDKDHWPDMADSTWEKSIHSYYGTQPDYQSWV
jgi:hypothetical protein